MDEIEIPEYFICPISLQIMKDPVTTLTGITFDRHSIEQWLSTATSNHLCPVTKQPLMTSDLTPNHILRRLIQAWCITTGIDRIPTPKSPLQRSLLLRLTRHVTGHGGDPLDAVLKLDELATENEKNRRPMEEAGVPRALLLFVLRSFRNGEMIGLEEALRTLQLLWSSSSSSSFNGDFEDNMEFVEALLWVLKSSTELESTVIRTHAITVLKNVIHVASSSFMEKLNPNFFEEMIRILRKNTASPKAVKSVLHILIQTCNSGRNRRKIVECGAVFEVIELELNRKPDKKMTELAFSLLANMCSFADGRQQVLKHAGGIAVVAKRLLRNTPATDEWALCVMELIARFSATREVVMEMLRVGAVTKLCMVLQADSADHLKKKAREILRLHSNAWTNSSCIQLYLLTRNPR